MHQFSNYDPARNILSFLGTEIVGWSDGTFVRIERTSDSFEMVSGAAGDITRRRIRDRTGSFTITLQQSSPSNDVFSAALALDERLGTGYGPVLFKDLNGATIANSAIAWVRKYAAVELADGVTGREWTIDCADLIVHVGGAEQIGI